MSKEIYISSTPHETRLAIVENDELTEIYYERENEYTLAGSIYNGRVTRVLPGMQSSFVDIGLERDAFLYITDFMEEAADTADFDHGEKPVRSPQLEASTQGRGERADADRNGDRYGSERNHVAERNNHASERNNYVSERTQEQARATPQTDMAQASEGRGEEFGGRGERSERGGRGRGRGRRDRGGNQADRQGQERGTPVPPAIPAEASTRFASSYDLEPGAGDEMMDVTPLGTAPVLDGESTASATPGQEIGEASPGADGSRRWRGRRGRRRGRGTGSRESALPGAAEASATPETADAGAPDESGYDAFDEQPVFEIDGSAAESPVMEAEPAQQELPSALPQRNESAGRRDQPVREAREDRGGRGDRSQRGERAGNRERSGGGGRNAPRAPRGFAPTRALYGVDAEPVTAETPEQSAAIEPLILPGESLGKYRKGADETSSAMQRAATAPSATENDYKIDPNWDGGSMLPGESLSRYRGSSASASQARGSERSDLRRPERRREGADRDAFQMGVRPADRTPTTPAAMMVPATVPPADRQSAGPSAGYASVDQNTEEIHAHRPDFTHASLPQATAEATPAHEAATSPVERIDVAASAAAHPAEAPVAEDYEPEGASASYRVDPASPREYRQSAPVAEVEERGQQTEPMKASGAAIGAHGLLLESVHAGDTVLYETQTEAPERAHEAESVAAASHEMTALDDLGTMVSTPEMTAAAAPLEAERVVLDATPEDSQEELEEPGEATGSAHQGFAPGAGDLEEDFLDEEELETTSLHAHGGEEFDEMDEEPLEGAADLGTMIRDMTLDHITRAGSGAEEEDDFEEDTLEEDVEDGLTAHEAHEPMEDEEEQEADHQLSTSGSDEEDGEGSRYTIGHDAPAEDSGPVQEASRQHPAAGGDAERRGRRDGRRSGRDRDRGRGGDRQDRSSSTGSNGSNGSNGSHGATERSGYDRGGLGERARNTGGGGDRERGRSGGRARQSMQMTNLPSISELLKPGQEILCQIAKEPIAKKGARITSHIALPGRFLVFMPTVMHTGVSRKIESDAERRRLKEILLSEKGDAAGGFIVRTAAGGASEDELRSDLRFLLNLWADIKARSESSKSPALIYHDLNLVERILRDQVTDNFSAIWVDTETEYERVLRFLQRFQPALIRRVKLYSKETPLFDQFGINEEINKALRSKVWLKSGGSIVINQTEALVAIDINTGKYVGKTARLEDTIVKTNLDAIPEIVRQIRLRDLGGIIIIDFIDMDERKNRNRVMAALEEELKNDRAPSKVLPFNDFGLVAITRKRVKQSLERTLSAPCTVCVGTGMVKSPVTVCNDIYIEMRKMRKHLDRGDVMLRVHPDVVKQLKATGSKWLQEMEEMCSKTILIKSDPALHPEQFDIH